MAIDKDLLDRLLEGREPSELFARGGLLDDLKKALSERRPRPPSWTRTWARDTARRRRPAGRTVATGPRPGRC